MEIGFSPKAYLGNWIFPSLLSSSMWSLLIFYITSLDQLVTYNILGICEIEFFDYTLTLCDGRFDDNFVDVWGGAIGGTIT
jgi:hypothetical protein